MTVCLIFYHFPNSFTLHLICSICIFRFFERILLHNFNVGLNFIAITLRLFVFCLSCTYFLLLYFVYCIVSKVLPVCWCYIRVVFRLFAVFVSLLLLLAIPIQTVQIENTIKCASLIALFSVYFSLYAFIHLLYTLYVCACALLRETAES